MMNQRMSMMQMMMEQMMGQMTQRDAEDPAAKPDNEDHEAYHWRVRLLEHRVGHHAAG